MSYRLTWVTRYQGTWCGAISRVTTSSAGVNVIAVRHQVQSQTTIPLSMATACTAVGAPARLVMRKNNIPHRKPMIRSKIIR
jgi:hypothetical protein